jgi:predicted Zn-dependent protease
MNKISIHALFILSLAGTAVFAQERGKNIILDAMNDELSRNMKELRMPDFEPPFYIMYGIDDQVRCHVSGTLGAITNSTIYPQRYQTNTRVLVGDYTFNDESLDDNVYSNPGAFELPLPMDDDYLGLRRTLWSTTDKVYRSAARHFEHHKQTLKESNKKLDELPHRSFAKSEPSKLIQDKERVQFDKNEWETRIRNLSALFQDRALIENSFVSMTFVQGDKYIITSEGTRAKLPHALATFTVMAQAKNEKGEFMLKRIHHMASTPMGLPDEKTCVAEINKLIAAIEEELKLASLEEDYSGPVLFLGESVADIFSMGFFRGKEDIMANDNVPKQTGFQYNNQVNALDGKIGKMLINEALTVKAKPKMKNYKGAPLFGSFDMDNEGIVPPDEIVVFEKGVLKELLNNRSITHASQKSNGCNSGPGVLEITSTLVFTEKQLREKLIDAARKQGLDYALIIREDASSMGTTLITKIYVADGKEENLRNANVSAEGLKIFRNMLGTTGDIQVVHQTFGTAGGGWNNNANIISYIVPGAVLMEEVEVKPYMMPTLKEEQYVTRP